MKNKTIILGFDGAAPELVEKWAGEGELPNFKKVIEEGCFGRLKTTVPPLTPCAWSSFMTGKNPGKHGIYDFFYLDGKKEMKIHSSQTRKAKDLWEILSKESFDSLVFNVPFTYPPKKINGTMVTDFTTPSLKSDFTYPKNLKEEILKKYPDFKVSEESKYSKDKKSKLEFKNEAFELADIRYKIFSDIMNKNKFDFSMAVFMLADHMQHWYWKYMDKEHPEHEKDEDLENTILNAYKKLDGILGETIEKYPDSNILIMSDHGGGPYYKDVTINKWLMDKGYLFLKGGRSPIKKITEKIGIDRLIESGLKFGLWKIINKIPFLKKNIQKKMLPSYEDIDWGKTKAYSYGYYGPIYLNKKSISNKEEFEKIKKDIKKELKEIKDPYTGERLIKNIWDRKDLYKGNESEKLPDIIINMGNFSYGSSSMFPFSSKSIFSEPKTFKSGDHTQHGIFMAYGPDIKKNKKIKNAEIYDIAPTVLHLYGLKNPKDMDGRVLKEIIK